MKENYEAVHKGFQILLDYMSGYLKQEWKKIYKSSSKEKAVEVLCSKKDKEKCDNIKKDGTYEELIDSLDILNCLCLLDYVCVYYNKLNGEKNKDYRNWINELKGYQNETAHIGANDLEQPAAERALNTMVLLCQKINPKDCRIKEIYKSVRARAADIASLTTYVGVEQPAPDSKRGALKEGSLLQLVDTDDVKRTDLTRKVTYGGKTKVYPVYRVKLKRLYYNDQNDRIATWITSYESEKGQDALKKLPMDEYNKIIEDFICKSNPEAIQATQNNMKIVGQTVPGVTLADGRVVDGNRRYTCLRRNQREASEDLYFETVIMDVDIQEDRKEIKRLELSIQHGEEQKVDYDLVDYAVGTYKTIVLEHTLTEEEYAADTNENISEVKKRIKVAEIIREFLDYLKLPEQYLIAREYQVYSLFQEMLAPLRQLEEREQQQLKIIVFNNIITKAIPDQKGFIRNIKNMIKNKTYQTYFTEQQKLAEGLKKKLEEVDVASKKDIDRFVKDNSEIVEKLYLSMQTAMYRYRHHRLEKLPVDNIYKCIDMMEELDPRLFEQMDAGKKENFKEGLDKLERIIKEFKESL